MDFTGHIVGLAKDFCSNLWHLTLELDKDTALEMIQNYGQDTKLTVHLAKYRKKRSNDANAYLWVLCDKIAYKIQSSKEEVYENMLKRYGTFYQDENGSYITVTVKKEVDMTKIDGHWFPCGSGYSNGTEFASYMMIKGSSEYDTKEMSKLLDGVVSEAKDLGIQTETDGELQLMLERWGEQYAESHEFNNK